MIDPDKYHRIADAAQRCGLNRRTLLSAVERDELPAATLGCGLRVVNLAAVRAWKRKERKRGPKPQAKP